MTAQPPVSDTSVRNTQQSSDMVERVAIAFYRHEWGWNAPPWEDDGVGGREEYRSRARVALEASHHAELVGALRAAGTYIIERAEDSYSDREEQLLSKIDAVLIKIGGNA